MANEASKQLRAAGITANVAPGVKPIPGVKDRRPTRTMHNWYGPLTDWYNNTRPSTDYVGFSPDRSVYVLEVGIGNYEIIRGGLFLQVFVKLIDSSDGRVIGRVRAFSAPKPPTVFPLDESLADNGKRYKEIFATEARTLIRECLIQLGVAQ